MKLEDILIFCYSHNLPLPYTNIYINYMVEDGEDWYISWYNDPNMKTYTEHPTYQGGGTDLEGIRKVIKDKKYILVNKLT